MKVFRSLAEVESFTFVKEGRRRAVEEAVRVLVEQPGGYDPAIQGHVVLVERSDASHDWLDEFGVMPREVIWEYAERRHGCIVALSLANNEFGRTVIAPDEAWLPAPVRRSLAREL